MTDKESRERLIELLKGAENKVAEALTRPLKLEEWLGMYADYLLANGVIVPPIKKVGEKLYFHQFNDKLEKVVVEGEIIEIANGEREYKVKLKDKRKLTFLISFFGKTVFLAKEEAEKALAQRSKE